VIQLILMKTRLPKLAYPRPVFYTEEVSRKEKEHARQFIKLLLKMDDETFEKVYPRTEQNHAS